VMPAGVIRLIWSPINSVNRRLPSGPAAMSSGELLPAACHVVTRPVVGLNRPIRVSPLSTYQRLASGPTASAKGPGLAPAGRGYSVSTTPLTSAFAILFDEVSVIQRKPPTETMSSGALGTVGVVNSVIWPAVVMRAYVDWAG